MSNFMHTVVRPPAARILHHWRRRAIRPLARAAVEPLEFRLLMAVYYVSPGGSDSNNGLDPGSPWQTVAKVNGKSFDPGDQILFQRGGQWRESLSASSSGLAITPIVYGAYGNPALAKPLFIGSDVLNPASFALVSGTTYSVSSGKVINWVYDNHEFLHSASVNTASGDGPTNVNYVKTHSGTFFFDPVAATLYLNLGAAPTGHTLTAAVREDAVFSNAKSFVTFRNLAVTETAEVNGGYAFRAQGGNNVTFLDCDASLAGKHHFGAINTTEFLGQGLLAEQSPPDLQFGAATAFVAFSDSNNGRSNNTSRWIDDTYTDPNGAYPAFLSHGDPGAIGSVLVQNLTSLSGVGTGIVIMTTGASERVTIKGGHIDGGNIQLDTNNSVIDGVKITGTNGAINVNGNNNVVQNCVIDGISPNPFAGHLGGIIDSGQGNTIRFNTFRFDSAAGPALAITTATSNTHVYANIFDDQQPIRLMFDGGNGQVDSHDNVFGTSFATGPVIGVGSVNFPATMPFSTWQGLGRDVNSVVSAAQFTNAAGSDFTLGATSPAVDFYTAAPDETVTTINTDFAGDTRPQGAGRDAGAFEMQPPAVVPAMSVAGPTVASPAVGQTTAAVFTITLDQAAAVNVSVDYATADGTASAGTDYDARSGALTFTPGQISKTVSVTVRGVAGATSNRTFLLNLINPVGATLATAQATATITPLPIVPQISVAGPTVAAPLAGATTTADFTVTLDQPAASDVSIDYATVDGTALAGTDYDAVSGTLLFAAGETSKTLSVTVHGVSGVVSDRIFDLELSNPTGVTLVTSQASATITPQPAGTTQTFDARHVLSYLDSAGHRVLVRLVGPGSGEAFFANGVADPTQISVTNSTLASSLIVTTIGGVTTLGDVSISGSLGIFGGIANLNGNLSIAGSARGIVLRDVSGVITIAQAGALPVLLRLGNATDLSLTSAGAIGALTATSWTDTDATQDTITAPSLSTFAVTGAFGASFNLPGDLGVGRVIGPVTGGTWSVGGGSRALLAGSFAAGWVGTFGGDIAAMLSFGDFAGSLTARSIRALRVGRDLTGALRLNNGGGALMVAGFINGAVVRSGGNINGIVAGAVIDSTITAGVDETVVGLPTSAAAFVSPASITLISVIGRRGLSAVFADSTIAASTLGRVLIGGSGVQTANNGTAFGIAAQSLNSYVQVQPPQRPFVWTSRQDPALLPVTGDFKVVVI